MLVWHIEYDNGIWLQHSVNNNASHQYVDILEADGIQNDATRAGDAFPGTSNVTSITPKTTPGFVAANGEAIDMSITEIEDGRTAIYVRTTDNSEITNVTVNGTAVDASAYDNITVVAGDEIVVTSDIINGVEMILGGRNDVYDLNGVKLMENAEPAHLSTLPAGIYVINGKKVIIR